MSDAVRSVFALMVFTVASWQLYGQERTTFVIPNSVLLFGSPDFELRIVTDTKLQTLVPPVKHSPFNYPALAQDGTRVAWGFPAANAQVAKNLRLVLGVSPIERGDWKTYGDFKAVGAAAFSWDGSRVAFGGMQEDGKSSLLILTLSTGKIEPVENLSGVAKAATLSWSPDGRQLVIELQRGDQPEEIAVADLATNAVRVIAKGVDPAWSPTGEWIAYSDPNRQQCLLVRPDGTNRRVVRDLSKNRLQYRALAYGAVWSPDGKKLLLNEMKGEGPKIDVMLLDIGTRRVTRKSKDGMAVFGWAKRMS